MSATENGSEGPEGGRRRAGGGAAAWIGAFGVALAFLALEAGVLAVARGPARPAEALVDAVPYALGVAVLVGAVTAALARGRRATDRVRLGVPAVLVGVALSAVHLRGLVLRPVDGMTSPRALAWFGGAAVVALGLTGLLAARPGRGGRSRAPLVALAALALLAAAWLGLRGRAPAAGDTDGPNVVLVVLDTTRVDRLSAFGYPRDTTPVLTRLAEEGTRFTRCYASAPWTVPSHAAMFTGVHTSTHGATRQRPVLDGRLPTLAERLSAAGLHTVAFAKKSWLSHETGLLRGFAEVHDLHNPPRQHAVAWLVERLRPREAVLDKGAAEIVDVAGRWLAEHGRDQRFFAFFNFNEAHSDLRPPRRFRERFLPAERHATEWGRSRFPENHAFSVGEVAYDEETLAILSDLYDAEVAYQDMRLGELVAAFEAAGLLDETLFLVTADHGENLGEHGLLGHEMSLHETLLHVPLVARLPGRVPAGASVDQPVENRLVGRLIDGVLGEHGEADAVGLAALLRDPGFEGIVSEEFAPNFQSPKWGFERDPRFDVLRKSLVDGTWKLHFVSNADPALYELGRDPGERTDLAGTEAARTAALLERLTGRADLWQDLGGGDVHFSPEMEERLKQMGYF